MKSKGSKERKASSNIRYEEENPELQDEIMEFHKSDRSLKKDAYKKKKRAPRREILNVEGDLSESDDNGNESSDFDEGVADDKWGSKRKEFYGTGFVDKDWGGMRDEEQEEAELEEEDALQRQKKLDLTAAYAHDIFDDENGDKTEQISTEVAKEWKIKWVRKMNKYTQDLMEEYENRRNMMILIISPLRQVIKALDGSSPLKQQLKIVVDVYSEYMISILYYLKIKNASLSERKTADASLDIHPVIEDLQKLKKQLKKVDAFLDKNSKKLTHLRGMVDRNMNINELSISDEVYQSMGDIHLSSKKRNVEIEQIEEYDENLDGDDVDEDSKRRASKNITKNKNYKLSTKKKASTSRTKNRLRFKNIEKKVKSQLGTSRTEMTKYSGESRGIRAGLVRSTKLIA